jgi:predicted DNA-binding protein (MmcQ/YjbR family)
MDHAALLDYLATKPGAAPGYPFDPTTRVYKVGNKAKSKMFALVSEDEDPLRINLKCDPDQALALRAQYESVLPGYHMDKKHWNTLVLDGSLGDALVKELIDHSYGLIVDSLPKKIQQELSVE